MNIFRNNLKKLLSILLILMLLSFTPTTIFAARKTNRNPIPNYKTTGGNSSFLAVAEQCKQKAIGYRYSQVNTVPPIGDKIDCSTFVCWSLYKYRF